MSESVPIFCEKGEQVLYPEDPATIFITYYIESRVQLGHFSALFLSTRLGNRSKSEREQSNRSHGWFLTQVPPLGDQIPPSSERCPPDPIHIVMFPGFWFTSSSKAHSGRRNTLGASAPITPPRLTKIFSRSKLPRSTGFRPRFEPLPQWERLKIYLCFNSICARPSAHPPHLPDTIGKTINDDQNTTGNAWQDSPRRRRASGDWRLLQSHVYKYGQHSGSRFAALSATLPAVNTQRLKFLTPPH
ncbi:hypothetical protein B0H19DRAFT_1084925 [Mycena capillaripes]|nr:hypothetical protein B0H19DRAFT_1084925 [Mycena capillaripes]